MKRIWEMGKKEYEEEGEEDDVAVSSRQFGEDSINL